MKALDARERQNWVNVLRIVSQIECENTDNTETKMSLVNSNQQISIQANRFKFSHLNNLIIELI
jgi:hypothetical protein